MKLSALGLLVLLGVASLVTSAATQPAAKQVKLGILYPAGTEPWPAFINALGDLGYQQDRNLKIEYRSANGHNEELPRLAAELVNLKPDVIVAGGTTSVLALKKATVSIPIVIAGSGDPVGFGLVNSLAHPGGNVTGTSDSTREIGPLRIQVLHEILPGLCCFIQLRNPSNLGNVLAGSQCTICETLGIERKVIEVSTADELGQVLASPIEDRFKAFLVAADALFSDRRAQIAEAALRRGLATFGPYAADAEAGFLVGHGLDTDEAARVVARYVDKIVKGAKPADLPVEQPTRFKLVINLKTAKALGITVPHLLLVRADEVIE